MTWNELAPGLWRSAYTTKIGVASATLAFRLADGRIAILSPPSGVSDAMFAETNALGEVAALIAPNSGHDVGQEAWQAKYPSAALYAPALAGPALVKSKPKLRPFEPLAALAPKLPAGVKIYDVAGVSAGFTMMSFESAAARVLLVDEALGNGPLSGPAPFRFIFWITGSGPGLARNKVWWTVFAKDKRAVATALVGEIDRMKPTILLPLHGEPITDVVRGRALIAEML